jgi:hypothetical protein
MIALVGTPWSGHQAIELGSDLWKKKLLPLGQVEYKGRTLTFDRDYLDGLASAFNGGAYSQVPFQLADGDNRHTNDPERYRGEVISMDADDTGLYITVQTTEAGNQLLRTNPKLGISARIIEDYARSDGKFYPAAVQHVLGTLDPRIPALGDWEAVDFSAGDPDFVLDLSTVHFAGEPVPEPGGGDLSDESLIDVLAEVLEPDELAVYAEFGEEALVEYLQAKYEAGNAAPEPEPQAAYNGQGSTEQFANDYLGGAIELAAAQAAIRQAEDAAPAAPRDEDRLATALRRIGAGTFTPSVAERQLGFAAGDDYAPGGGGCSCGAIAWDGSTAAAHHLAGCDSLTITAGPDELAAVVRETGLFGEFAAETATDADGFTWLDQYGRPMSMTGLIESNAGQRLTRDDPFEGLGRPREVLRAQRAAVFGDPDDPDDPGLEFDASTRQAARDAAAAMGITPRSAAQIRDSAIGQMVYSGSNPARPKTIGAAMDLFGETARERAERVSKSGVYPVQVNEPVLGEQPVYSLRAG